MPGAIDWVELSRLVPGLAAVVVFVVLMLRVLERQDRRDDKRDVLFLQAVREQRESWQKVVSESGGEWRDALKNFQDSHSASISRLAEEMKTLGLLASATNSLIVQHDTWERIELERRFPPTS